MIYHDEELGIEIKFNGNSWCWTADDKVHEYTGKCHEREDGFEFRFMLEPPDIEEYCAETYMENSIKEFLAKK